MKCIHVHTVGPIVEARVEFGDLTVFVGPQATGKGIFLQLLKLVVDKPVIHEELQRFGIDWNDERDGLLDVYLGEGMAKLWTEGASKLLADGHEVEFARYAGHLGTRPIEKMSYIPAQRVLSFRDGITRPFTDYRSGDPYVLRAFSDQIHQLVQNEFSRSTGIFPHRERLSSALAHPLEQHVFGGFQLETEHAKYQRRIVLRRRPGASLPFLVWSAGQREFVPLLMGLYPLLPPSAPPRGGTATWVVIEEPEMGLHPNGIGAVLNLVLQLLASDHRVCISTHSPHVLDIVWALRFFQGHGAQPADVLELLGLKSSAGTRELAKSVLTRKLLVYYFPQTGQVRDISNLDPAAESLDEAGWGGLTGGSGRVGDLVAHVAARSEQVTRS